MNTRLKELRKLMKLSQKKFGEKLGLSESAISNMESGRYNITDTALLLACQNFNVNETWLRTGEGDMFNTSPISLDEHAKKEGLSEIEIELIKITMSIPRDIRQRVILQMKEALMKFDTVEELTATISLNETQGNSPILKNNVKNITYIRQGEEQFKKEKEQATEKEQAEDNEIDEDDQIEKQVYTESAAAGFGNYLSDDDYNYEWLTFKAADVPDNADFGVKIQGDSMEPAIHDGDIVWVEAMIEIPNHRIGIFILNGKAYCKKLDIDHNNRMVYLASLNDNYDDIPIKADDELRTVGEVIGTYRKQ